MAVRQTGQPIFTEKQRGPHENALRDILIKIFIENNITFEEFSRRHREYMLSIGAPVKQITSSRNNLLKVILHKDTLTYSRFEMILKNIIGYNLINVKMTFKDKEGIEHVIDMDRMSY